jgi:site-specific recombinase XerD
MLRRWIEHFIRFHHGPDGWRHPSGLDATDVERFLTHLAVQRRVSASTQNQALNAVVFLYREVLKRDLGEFNAVRARRTRPAPTVLSAPEVQQLLAALDELSKQEPYALMVQLMYGAGLRLMECCRLRVKDIDLERGQLGHSDVRTTMIYTHVMQKAAARVRSPLDAVGRS